VPSAYFLDGMTFRANSIHEIIMRPHEVYLAPRFAVGYAAIAAAPLIVDDEL